MNIYIDAFYLVINILILHQLLITKINKQL